ncbi:MAG: bifunctional phosphopantothenoylcysteine decarboxylase/phosphopantothenate--cysteine ligase CoaBC [Firmicutes bacterium]|nr:bifunctional phosphopantothenoylcysteine decarboxylase/phosphopantothenate--cysteine ligase CoaBC [Bacillota bacterium]
MRGLAGRNIVLGVSGSIAAYKAADVASRLVQAGATVDTVMTPSAIRFVAPLTFQSLTHRPVVTDLFDPRSELSIDHVALARRADAVLIAPATADLLSRMAHGLADDPVTATVLATAAPVIVCPAMESHMYRHPATQENLERLVQRGVRVVEPAAGRLASGQHGIGRLADPGLIIGTVRQVLGRNGDLSGRRVVVTAGGTREAIDPVRYITNRSSGKMGHALAEAARDRGAAVVLVTAAPVGPETAAGIDVRPVSSALEMMAEVQAAVERADALIMAAAVADYRPAAFSSHKVKKTQDQWELRMVRNPDILASVRTTAVKVGFAAETQDLRENALAKLKAKGLHMIVANDVTAPGSGFESDTNQVTIIDRSGRVEELPSLPKMDVAHEILDRLVTLLP